MNLTKIVIIGNSVSLRVRPPLSFPYNKNYSKYLEEEFHQKGNDNVLIYNMGLGAFTVQNVYSNIDNYINKFPDYYIINVGVVDASTREIPLWFYRLAVKKKMNLFYLFFAFIYRKLIIKIRPLLVHIRFKRSWISVKKFVKYFDLIIYTLCKETNARIIVLSINIANERVEKELPGTRNKHKIFNEYMERVTNKYNQVYIDTNSIVSSDDYPDGVHFSKSGHMKIAGKIFSEISAGINNNKA